MSLPSPRKIIIENTEYEWLCKQNVLRNQELPQTSDNIYSESRLYIESTEAGHSIIEAIFDSRHLFGYSFRAKYVDYLAITPAVVAAVIRYAISNGWGETKGKKFVVSSPSVIFEKELRLALKDGSKWDQPEN